MVGVFLSVVVRLNGKRQVTGVLRGYDQFMNLVLEDAVEEISPTERHSIGIIVSLSISLPLFPSTRESAF